VLKAKLVRGPEITAKVALTTAFAELTVIVVDANPELANVTDPVGLALQYRNVYPELAFAVIGCPATPAAYQVADEGVVVPVPVGVTAKVTWYCVFHPAVSVIGLFITALPGLVAPL
jgi:hypothetical protein